MCHSSPLKNSNFRYLALEYIFHCTKLQMQRQTSGKLDILILCHKCSHHHHSSKHLPMLWFCHHKLRHSVDDEIVLDNLLSSGHCNPILHDLENQYHVGSTRWQELFYKNHVKNSVEYIFLPHRHPFMDHQWTLTDGNLCIFKMDIPVYTFESTVI